MFRSTAPRRGLALLVLGLAMTVAAGCGSDDDSSSNGGAEATASSGSTDTGVADAKATVEKATQTQTKIPVTTPIDKEVPGGKKLVFISCGVAACEVQGDIVKTAASKLGWTTSAIGTDGSPQQVAGAFATAIRQKADAVILNAASRDVSAKSLADLQKAGIPFVTCCSVDEAGPDILANITSDGPAIGDYLAAWSVAQTDGKVNSLYVNISAFQILAEVGKSYDSSLKKYCPDCKNANLDIPLTALGKDAPDRIVSYLRSHPDVNYVVLSVSDALGAGLPAALKAAGLGDKVKIIGQGADATILQEIANGNVEAVVPFDYFSVDYQMVDVLARHFTEVDLEIEHPPTWLATKDNLPSSNAIFPVVKDYEAQFLALWGKG